MVTSVTSGTEFIRESFQVYLKLGSIQARMHQMHFEDYALTVPLELQEIVERINTLALKKLVGEEEIEFRGNIDACRFKCAEIQDSLNNTHEVMGDSLLKVVQAFVTDKDLVNLSRRTILKTFKGFKKHIMDLEKVNSSSKAADYIKAAKNLIEKNESNSFDITTGSSSAQSASSTTSSSSFICNFSSGSASNSFASSFLPTSSSTQSSSSPSCVLKSAPSHSEESSDEGERGIDPVKKITQALDSPITAFLNSLYAKLF